MGTNCPPSLLTYFFILTKVIFRRHNKKWPCMHRKLARSFNLCFRYVNDLMVVSNKKFWEYVKDIYSSQLNVERTNQSHNLASYLDLTFTIQKDGRLSTKPYDKRDDFDFHIVNFPFLPSNIPFGPNYGVYITQLIRYCCSCCS